MAISARSIADALGGAVGADRVSEDPAILALAAVGGRSPRWLVRPASVEHVSRVLALASTERLAVVPRGSGSNLDLGAPPARLDIVLDLCGLRRVLDYNPDDLTASAEAGVTLGELSGRLSARRQWLPLDPPGGSARTLGGVVAANASGPLRCRYGTMRDLLLGVRFVQADGVVTWGGARVVKSVTGYDVPKLMIGALGTLGVIVELTLRLHPEPETERSSVAAFPDVERAHAFVTAVLDSTVQPSRLEILNRRMADLVPTPGGGAFVAISIGGVDAAVGEQERVLHSTAAACGGAIKPLAADWWDRYGACLAASAVTLRVATLTADLAQAMDVIERAFAGVTAPAVGGCAAVGALTVCAAASDSSALRRAVNTIRDHVAPLGGHAVVARAPRELVAGLDPWGPVDRGALGLMRGLKDEFDAARVLNPGRYVGGL
jgi:glycolate dehydrogenase FAD-binding subunit